MTERMRCTSKEKAFGHIVEPDGSSLCRLVQARKSWQPAQGARDCERCTIALGPLGERLSIPAVTEFVPGNWYYRIDQKRPSLVAHRIDSKDRPLCGKYRGNMAVELADAPADTQRCELCTAAYLDWEESLSRYVTDEKGCWVWTGYRSKEGYGRACAEGKIEWAHRASYRLHVGEIPEGHELDHTCQNPPCINPAHLEPVTRKDHARRTYDRLGQEDVYRWAASLRREGMAYRDIAKVMGWAGMASAQYAVKSAIERGFVQEDDIPQIAHMSKQEREDARLMDSFGIPKSLIAQIYGVSESHLSRVCNGKDLRNKGRAS